MNKIVLTIFVSYWLAIVSGNNSIYRLPTTTYPIEYKIWLNTSLDSDGFNGQVEIKIGVKTVTNEIIVNSYDLDINSIELFKVSGEHAVNIPIVKHIQDIPYSLRLQLKYDGDTPVKLDTGREYVLKLVYSGKFVTDSTTGIYKSKFDDNTLIVTNFLPQFARRAFPCYDEPQFRTPFTLSIMHPVECHAISNMPIESDTAEKSGLITTTFHTTPPLSPHSIAFAITNYKSLCNENGLKICVFYDSQHIMFETKLVLQTAEKMLVKMQEYYGDVLDISKLDILPVHDEPNYIIGNYGLLINKESLYYYDPLISHLEQKQRVIRHTVRQILNVYFINVITPESWTDVWINDGISIMLEKPFAEMLYPELDFRTEFINSICQISGRQIVIKPSGDLTYHDILTLFDTVRQYSSAYFFIFLNSSVGGKIFREALIQLLNSANKSYSSESFFNIFESLTIKNGPINGVPEFISTMNRRLIETDYMFTDGFKDYNTCVIYLLNTIGDIELIDKFLLHLEYELMEKMIQVLAAVRIKSDYEDENVDNEFEDYDDDWLC